MKLHKESHTDHVSDTLLGYVLDKFADASGFFTETFTLPDRFESLTSDLYGPIAGDDPIMSSDKLYWEHRGSRPYRSRMINLPPRPTREVTVIAGPFGDEPCVLYTVFGGPLAPKEPDDPTLTDEQRRESEEFWHEHALATPKGETRCV